MTLPRRAQVSLAATPHYHCIARCVRRAFLCGDDPYSGKNFEHRKLWLLDRIRNQAAVFAVDVCAYAIMSNHYHLVLSIDQERALKWSDEEVIRRWTKLFKGPILVQRLQAGEFMTAAQKQAVCEVVAVWRQRLSDISWYMRCLNEFIARRANAEDKCAGRFWEGRFKSKALLDQASLLTCMAYVDLNPIRAGMAKTLAESNFTSVQERLQSCNTKSRKRRRSGATPLLPFLGRGGVAADAHITGLSADLQSYLDLVDATGRQIILGKRAVIPASATRLLDELALSARQWEILSLEIQAESLRAIGSLDRLRAYSLATGRRRTNGAGVLRLVYSDRPLDRANTA